jgi:integrase/recombinase XerD
MLNDLLPKKSTWYFALPLLGQVADDFDTWLSRQGYRRCTRRQQVRALVRIDRDLRRRGHREWASVRQADLDACWRQYHGRDPRAAATIRGLGRFLQEHALLPAVPSAVTRVEMLAKIYGAALDDLRGLAPLTIRQHVTTAEQFLRHLDYQLVPERLATLTASDLEAFVGGAGKRLSRPSLQHTVARLRSFLRFLASSGKVPAGLDRQIDTPRVYRQEHLPRSLPWSTVQALLQKIGLLAEKCHIA